MKLSALDVQQKEFARRFRGFDREEVRAFLDEAAKQIEELAAENISLREELKRREERIAELDSRQKLVEETLTTAQRLTDEMKGQARKEAENIVAEAELRAEILLQQANERVSDVMGQIAEMKRQRGLFASQLEQAAKAQLRLLESLDTEPAPLGTGIAPVESADAAETVQQLPRAVGADD